MRRKRWSLVHRLENKCRERLGSHMHTASMIHGTYCVKPVQSDLEVLENSLQPRDKEGRD